MQYGARVPVAGSITALVLTVVAFLSVTGCRQVDTVGWFVLRGGNDVRVVEGMVDLRGVDLSRPVSLDGDWFFYPDVFLEPPAANSPALEQSVNLIPVPAVWNRHVVDGERFGAHRYGTYRLDLVVDDPEAPLYLHIREITSAFRIYADDILVLQGGDPGTTRSETTPEWVATTRGFTPETDHVTILIHVANFHHARGGIRDGVLLSGDRGRVAALQARKNAAFLVFGALVVMGIYHLVLIRVRAKDRSTLWFGLVSILMAMRTLLTGQPAVLVASSTAGWEALMTLEYFSMYAGVTLFYLYVHALFPREMHRIPLRTMQLVGVALSVLTLLTPARIFSATLYGYHVVVVLGSVYLLVVAVRAFRAGRDGTVFFALGMVILALSVFNDVLYNLGVLPTEYLSGFGMLFFLFFQSLILASRFAADARRVEELLSERTRLEALTFLDDLTGISNRRHFDKTIATEWTRARRHGQPLSIVMADIDAFKLYNDHYGHLMGDEVLSRVARTLHNNLHRSSDLVARYGGEEFAVVLPATDREGALSIAEAMRAAVEALQIEHSFSDAIPVLTASFGVATAVPDRHAGYDALLHEADKALYRAKLSCKNCVF